MSDPQHWSVVVNPALNGLTASVATEDWSDDEIAILVEDEEADLAASKRKEQRTFTTNS